MRMHRGSSKEDGGEPRPSETLPLSASPTLVEVAVEVARAGESQRSIARVAVGTLVRDAVRPYVGSPEGCAVLIDEESVPLDLPIDRPVRLLVVPTFSGG